jgi:uncharacterized LabA/DUF88 family protein
MDRVAIFIDGSNFYHALKSRFGSASVSFGLLSAKLCGADRRLLRTYYYNASKQLEDDPLGDQQRFFSALSKIPYLEVRLGRLERRYTGIGRLDPEKRKAAEGALGTALPEFTLVEKGVDVQLAVDMVEMARKNIYDVAVLITGDGDFSSAVGAVKDMGKYVELAHVEGQPCRQLQSACDIEVVLDQAFLSNCWVPIGPKKK